ncbi:DUF4302 domain-containing protein [Arcticibacter tournemirensis]|uniref:DUF4302 domain-containing protein n=1 Tax=Arcticibacter tournemirensis TaxID=699437 RepID=A0A4Q0M6N3_9SPHI|nr:DUF4302 domain-containing protein [Arcticibacter tournemirensis]RXF68707.1 DUF4302 domain-containing protein [Arcticibacter tournemirensis]
MKKILLSILAFSLLLGACKKDDTVNPEDKPDAKLIKVLDDYKSQLTGAEFGWKAYLMPDGGGVYSFLFKFDENERVQMLSDINPSFEDAPFESSYRLKAIQRPSLFFDTYSYIHLLADPDIQNNGLFGTGQYSDFEFSFVSTKEDTITLEGNYNHSKLLLIKAKSQDEFDDFMGNIQAVAGNFTKLRTYFKRMTVNGIEYELNINPAQKVITFAYSKEGSIKNHSSFFYVDGNSIVLTDPFDTGGTTINSLSGISYNSSGFVSASVNGATVQIVEAIQPMSYDLSAASRFNAVRKQYISYDGFTRDGNPDSYNIKSIPGLSFLLLWTKYNSSYDLAGFTFGNSIRYGPAVTPLVKSDGKVYYTFLGTLGTIPAAYRSIVLNTGNAFGEEQSGFYVIQVSNSTYDLVSADDARKWIRFE